MTAAAKRALVTGGSGSLGSAICRELAARGCHVIVHANTHLDAAQAQIDLEARKTTGKILLEP